MLEEFGSRLGFFGWHSMRVPIRLLAVRAGNEYGRMP